MKHRFMLGFRLWGNIPSYRQRSERTSVFMELIRDIMRLLCIPENQYTTKQLLLKSNFLGSANGHGIGSLGFFARHWLLPVNPHKDMNISVCVRACMFVVSVR